MTDREYPDTPPPAVSDALITAILGGRDDDTAWMHSALCAQTDPDAFFPEKGGDARPARRICAGCDVRAHCLSYALTHDERFGIWAGLSLRERRRAQRAAA